MMEGLEWVSYSRCDIREGLSEEVIIWLIWKDEKKPGTKWFHAEGTARAKVQRLE